MAFRPSEKRKSPNKEVDIDTTPVMNLMVVLIPLLLSAAKFTEIALLEYLPPAETDTEIAGGGGGAGASEEMKTLDLRLNLSEDGVELGMFEELEPGPHYYEIPVSPNGRYDWDAVHDSLVSIKKNIIGPPTGKRRVFNEGDSTWTEVDAYQYEDATEVSLTAIGNTPFQSIVKALDICQWYTTEEMVEGQSRKVRKELFPNTVLK